jgi:hypothetical protein
MKVDLCKSCGAAFDVDEVNDGYCLNCPTPEIDNFLRDSSDSVEWCGDNRPELDMSRIVTDCE